LRYKITPTATAPNAAAHFRDFIDSSTRTLTHNGAAHARRLAGSWPSAGCPG
jgi:hypothetical protein